MILSSLDFIFAFIALSLLMLLVLAFKIKMSSQTTRCLHAGSAVLVAPFVSFAIGGVMVVTIDAK